MTNELISKAKECKSVEELFELAKENNIEMTAEEAKAKFAELHNEGELSDDELDSAAGGACHRPDGRMVTTVGNGCDYWTCKKCGKIWYGLGVTDDKCECRSARSCNDCKYISYEKGLWICNNDVNRK